ncbi:MAG: FixH family protein [Chlorobiaceae bacterium]|jgi:hypothetical protein|nr:FixH family protein [Chlorobiaceae bacterium]
MKVFLIFLYILFLFAMASGIIIAYQQAEGLVENNYYEKGSAYFHEKAEESSSKLAISHPDSLRKGKNDVRIKITAHGKPLEHAVVTLFIGNLSKKKFDTSLSMYETTPGIYQAQAMIPFNGVWLVRVDMAKEKLKTSRKWFIEIN